MNMPPLNLSASATSGATQAGSSFAFGNDWTVNMGGGAASALGLTQKNVIWVAAAAVILYIWTKK